MEVNEQSSLAEEVMIKLKLEGKEEIRQRKCWGQSIHDREDWMHESSQMKSRGGLETTKNLGWLEHSQDGRE